jgi:hypothetical protein
MTPTNLPDLYSRVVAKRPELAVPHLAYDPVPHWRDTVPRGWCFHGDYAYPESDETAAALILAKWVEALPEHVALERVNDTWWVYHIARERGRRVGPTPLEALAAFWLECEA